MKGFVSILEMITVVIVLFIAFQFFFPGFSYKSRWGEALLILKARDIILTSDRTGNLYKYSFSSASLRNFLDTLVPTNETNILSWSETEGTIKNTITIACNCTKEQRDTLAGWLDGLKINNRDIDFYILDTRLDIINTPPFLGSDVLLIWDYKGLKDYLKELQDYMSGGRGIIEIMDLVEKTHFDEAQEKIFGLRYVGKKPEDVIEYEKFRRKPDNSSDIIYETYKYFYHVPVPLRSLVESSYIPTEGLTSPNCSQNTTGNMTLNQTVYKFWVCDGSTVYFDTNASGSADKLLSEGDEFTLRNYDFKLSYVEQYRIGVSFKPDFEFEDFIRTKKDVPAKPGGVAWGVYDLTQAYPVDDNKNRILLEGNVFYKGTDMPIPAVILNSTKVSNVAWIADFSNDRDLIGDDQRLILISLLLWASNKGKVGVLSPQLKIGYLTSYVNVNNRDMYEVYRFNLGMGYPF